MARKRLADIDYYELLGLERDANQDQVKGAFHKFALKYHPDRTEVEEDRAKRTLIYRRGTEAYRVLSHPQLRSAYDHGLGNGQLRLDSAVVGARNSVRPPSHRPVSPRARPFLVEAESAVARGDYRTAHVHVQVALGHDAEHPELLALLAKIETSLNAE